MAKVQNNLFKQATRLPIDSIYRLTLTEELAASEDNSPRALKHFMLEADIYNSTTRHLLLVFNARRIFGSASQILEEEAISISESIAISLDCELNVI